MDYIKSFFSKDTKRGRAVRTGIQVFVAMLGFAAGLLAIPGIGDFLYQQGILAQAGSVAILAAIVSYIYNALEGLLNWLGKE